VCFYLPSIADPTCVRWLKGVVLPPVRDAVGVCGRIAVVVLRWEASGLVAPLGFVCSSVRVSGVLVPAVRCGLIGFRLDPVSAASWLVSFDVVVLSILRRYVACASSVRDGLDSLRLKFSCFLYISQSEASNYGPQKYSVRPQGDTRIPYEF
jgi:hypothetical protein